MKKLTAKEILEIVEKNFELDDFAQDDYGPPNDFVHPDYNTRKKIEYPHDLKQLQLEYSQSIKDYYEARDKEYIDSLGLGKIVEVDQYGGEGMGDEWYSVKHFVDHDIYIKTTGFYQSHSGVEFYNGYGEEVFPKQKVITVYE